MMLHDYVLSALLLVVDVVGAAALFTLLWRKPSDCYYYLKEEL